MSRRGKLPEAEAISRDGAIALTMLQRTPSCGRGGTTLAMQTRRARSAIARIATKTGDDPAGVMEQLGLTTGEIARIGAFNRKVIWS